MIIVMKPGAPAAEREKIKTMLLRENFQINEIIGASMTVLGVIGDTSTLDPKRITVNDFVEKVMRVQEPFKRANRLFHPDNSIVNVSGVPIGGKKLAIIAGPCSIETDEQMAAVAEAVKAAGAHLLRGGAFKPRTSPYSFQGLKERGLGMLHEAGNKTNLPIVTEIMSADKIGEFVETVDLIQVGARNMQNFELLKELGKTNVPILLKRGLAATIEEWIMAAEYIMAGGNENVILCERGIRTYETYTRNTLDLSAIPAAKKLSHLPVIVDPSHAAGMWWMVEPLAKAAIAAGADGLMIEVHNDPENAWCDAAQSLKPDRFANLMKDLRAIAPIVGREL
ncbi:MAG TPA: 3-deoxy-7-phosphoheptulonate synthase [Candidatus Avacidaminococcus intestinavium]|uniref:3-deoxy-7-phosphoheptulonate synthase n=1 Tax=Candidatus Avacidaminococcus intestinavium TaxID=2840684 RepID=A0A9D1SL99_9FIRM|nr:3-deoxy-7-phosphoheptulonate synthase [Candidatus Avacidaminococcus intestinavium]